MNEITVEFRRIAYAIISERLDASRSDFWETMDNIVYPTEEAKQSALMETITCTQLVIGAFLASQKPKDDADPMIVMFIETMRDMGRQLLEDAK